MNPAAPVTNSFIWGPSLDVDLAVVADHQAQGPRPGTRAADDRLPADEAVLEPGDVEDTAVGHDDGVLDLAVDDFTVLADRAERPDEAVDDAGARADHDRAADRRVDDHGALGDD